MTRQKRLVCPDCEAAEGPALDRRSFLKGVTATAAAAAAGGLPLWAVPRAGAAPTPKSAAETTVKALYDSLTDAQKKDICFDWDHKLRSQVSNNWQVTKHAISSNFYTKKQQELAQEVFKGLIHPDWYGKFLKQAKDDNKGLPWGAVQSLGIFGKPGTDQFECVITGRHMTLRADGNSDKHAAFGGPVFYGHLGGNEPADHKGNVFWHQGEAANKLYKMLDGKQQEKALLARRPNESNVSFRGPKAAFPGLPLGELADDQEKEMQKVLATMLAPFRTEDQDRVQECLKKLGGLDKCSLAYYKDGDIGDDGVWDNWKIEGPAFVWYFRGTPHIHVWVHVADDPSVRPAS